MNTLAITWNADPMLFGVIRWYSLLMFVSIYISFSMLSRFYTGAGIPGRKHTILIMYQTVFCLVGARLGHCLLYDADYFLSDPVKILYVWEGGLASHGGAFGIILGLLIYQAVHLREKSILWLLDRITLSMVPGMVLIRLGNFMNSELYGTATDLPWGVIFAGAEEAGEIARHPVQLYEAFSYLVFFFALWFFILKRIGGYRDGMLFGIILAVVLTIRFFLEFLKDFSDGVNIFGFEFYTGQVLSMPFMIVAALIIYFASRPMKAVGQESS